MRAPHTAVPATISDEHSVTRLSDKEVTRLFGKTMPVNLMVAGIETD